MLIGLPSTLPPKSSIAICAAVTEPWPVGVDAGPFMSVSTPILTTSSDTCASAAVDASIAAASAANSPDRFLANILSSPVAIGALAAWLLVGGLIAPIGLICNYFAAAVNVAEWERLTAGGIGFCLFPARFRA